MKNKEKDLIQITKEYYDSKEADEFYYNVWGGEDIHIGIYDEPTQDIKSASQQTVWKMAKFLPAIKRSSKILDLGSGYGGAARLLAKKYECKIDCLNLSETENERNRTKNKNTGLEDFITVTTGNFEKVPFDDEVYDIVWMQDALLHSNNKPKVFEEVARVLKPRGRFIFTDPMQSDDCPDGVLQPVLNRIHLQEMGSVIRYRHLASKVGLEPVMIKQMPEQLVLHYSQVLNTLKAKFDQIRNQANEAYLNNMMIGLQHWIDAGQKGYLNWAILQFQKRNV